MNILMNISMNRFITAWIAFASSVRAANSSRAPDVVYSFESLVPSTELEWSPCFDDLSCTRLQVPLDYANPTLGNTSIAFIKLAGKNATANSPSIVFIPGGPGGSGINLLLESRDLAALALGDQYNIVSFDPRGVNNSGPSLDCFSGNQDARLAFQRLHRTGATNISSTSLAEQYYSASIFGDWCNDAVARNASHGYYVTTPAVARDLLSFTEAEARLTGRPPSEAKLWSYGASYGTVVGSTFASLFPSRVGRMVLDGVLNAEQYYTNNWRDNFDQMDAVVASLATMCHAAGAHQCALWSPTPAAVTARLDALMLRLQDQPLSVSGVLPAHTSPQLATYADLKTLLFNSVYRPAATLAGLADVLLQVERGNGSALAGTFDRARTQEADARFVIQCVDSYRRNKLATVEDFKRYIEYTFATSRYLGDIYPIILDTVACQSIRPNLPDSMVLQDPISGVQKATSFPILFASNKIDPLSPLKSARTMSSRFPGSVLLVQDAVGHTVIDQGGSACYFAKVQAYFGGIVPPADLTCPQ